MKSSYRIDKYVEKLRKSENYFHTFIDTSSMSAGVLVLGPDEKDTQEPHELDEVYFIVSGDGLLRIGDRDYEVLPHRAFFVAKDVPHFFYKNTKELVVWYFFGGPDVR